MSQPYLWDPWATAAEQPERTAVIADEERCSYRELVRTADAFAAGLQAHRVPAGATVSTDIPTGPLFFALALAALRHGYGLLPVGRALLASATGHAVLRSMTVVLHVMDDQPARWATPMPPCPVLTATELTAAGAAVRPPTPAARAGYLAFTTSGTTGEPQGVPRPRPPRPYRGVAVAERYGAGRDLGPHLMANPSYHLGTLGPALYALQAGSAVVVQRSWSPCAFAELVDRHRADSAMLSPDRLLDLVGAGRAPARRLRVLFHGGAACPPAVKRAAIELLGPVLHEYYGTSRGTLTEITVPQWLAHPGSVGRPLAGIGIEILAAGRPVPAGELGSVHARLRGADRAAGEPDLLDTGDIGFLDPDGYLFVVGRTGQRDPLGEPLLEHGIRLLNGVFDVAVLGGADQHCFVESSRSDTAGLSAEVAATARRLGLLPPRLTVAPPGSLPRTPSGKIHRAGLAGQRAAQGS
ncbi:AMP-binding protein [Kitasatospora acidiphila]|uniref:AMP-binding protein n=1 Tax=Kitasatospora acidiphila TaxID=2567942 RepID=A0A540WGK3_9ACTN|nr:AMP-binding protein [Kitasatospora acidiphila]TQF08027.1 AMP-binding protein [Kitasatospora acidiphila]